jgi:ferredoxin
MSRPLSGERKAACMCSIMNGPARSSGKPGILASACATAGIRLRTRWRLRGADGYLHDLRRHGRFPDPPRVCPARRRSECLDLLDVAYGHNLVQFGENVQRQPSFICNCCGCCCEALMAARKFGLMNPVETTNFCRCQQETCTGCGKCVHACPVEALGLVSANDPADQPASIARLDERICLGCGVCVRACPTKGAFHWFRARNGSSHRSTAPPDCRDGHRARQTAKPDLRQPGAPEPPAMAAILGVILRCRRSSRSWPASR